MKAVENNEPKRSSGTGAWGLLGLAAIPVLCCGLPIFMGTLGFTAVGAVLAASRYWILGGLVILMGIVMFIVSRKGRKSGKDSCCAVPPSDRLSKGIAKE